MDDKWGWESGVGGWGDLSPSRLRVSAADHSDTPSVLLLRFPNLVDPPLQESNTPPIQWLEISGSCVTHWIDSELACVERPGHVRLQDMTEKVELFLPDLDARVTMDPELWGMERRLRCSIQ